jgi:hypothetical protein
MKKYGLVDSDDQTVRVSELALRILHPASEEEQLKAIQEAALKPELFASLYETRAEASDDALRSYLITKLGFSQNGASQVSKAFRETMSLSRLDKTEHITPYESHGDVSVEVSQSKGISADEYGAKNRQALYSTILSSTQSPSQTYSWPLGQGVSAEVRITGGELLPEYFDALRQYLALAEKLVKPVFQEGDKVEYVDAYTGETRYGVIERMYGSNAIIHAVTKEEAGPNPKRFTPRPDPARVAKNV